MKKMFCKWTVGAILVAMLGTGVFAQQPRSEDKQQKQKVRIVVVEKKEGGTSGSGSQSQKHAENRDKKT